MIGATHKSLARFYRVTRDKSGRVATNSRNYQDMPRPRTSPEHKARLRKLREQRYRRKYPLTAEQKARKKIATKARQQTTKYKEWAAAKYQARREAMAAHPRPDLCEICGNPPDGMGALHFDHCHTTGRFRGWLCHGCNIMLGMASDDPALLRKMADYLERFPRPSGPYQKQQAKPTTRKQPAPLPLLDHA